MHQKGRRCYKQKGVTRLEYGEIEEIDRLCEPIKEYLTRHYNPHTEVCISFDGVFVKQVVLGIPEGWQSTDAVDCQGDMS